MKYLKTYEKILETDVIENMREYWEDEDDEIEKEKYLDGVEECRKILVDFLEKAGSAVDETAVLNTVKWAVENLNDLNEKYDSMLIETEEREDICGFIFDVLEEIGIETEGDITEEWREW